MFKINRFLTILSCLMLLAAFTGCASTSKQESTGQYIDNSVITSKVKTAIFQEPTLKSLQITVESFKGEVQLSGFVDSAKSAAKAGEIARGVEGVVSVKNDLVVK
ncbi:MAG: BON domain-containing protein [Desulfuromonadaceae bacterium]|nr:BON domain-containing protein [Desulfuromonadaceae bacterium]